jgi:dimethylaniline monooxygenase (N-oxide forming)
MKRRVGIIGAGLSGLSSAKECIDNGLEPNVFEKLDDIGGKWSLEGTATWPSMLANITRYHTSLSEYPDESRRLPLYMNSTQTYLSITDYVSHFNLQRYIRLGTNVIQVNQEENQTWKITWIDTKNNNSMNEDYFDYLIVASGMYTSPHIPLNKNSHLFKGKIIHSKYINTLLNSNQLGGKNVLVVGISNIGAELSCELLNHGAQVTNVFRRPYWILPRYISIDPIKQPNRKYPIDFFMFNREQSDLTKKFSTKLELYKYQNKRLGDICKEQLELSTKVLFIDPSSEEPPKVCISNNYVSFVKTGKIDARRGTISEFTENGVILDDGCYLPADIVLYATGYNLKLDFMEKEVLDLIEFCSEDQQQPIILYKSTFHLNTPTCAFVGLLRESFGILKQLQARYASLVFSGKVNLPNRNKFEQDLCEQRAYRNDSLRPQYSHFNLVEYVDSIANEMNVLPNLDLIKIQNLYLWSLMYKGVLTSAQYLFNDNRDIAEKLIIEANEAYNTTELSKNNSK